MSPQLLSVKARLLEVFEKLVDPLLERADTKAISARTAEEACWEAVLPLGAALLTTVLGIRCRAESERLLQENGWTLEPNGHGLNVRLRLDGDYTARLKSTFGPVAVPLFAIRKPSPGAATFTPAKALFPHYPRM